MMLHAQIALDPETHRLARRRAGDLGVSLAEYIRRLVARDLAAVKSAGDPSAVFDLGASTRSDIRESKDAIIGDAFASHSARRRR
jgi:hypothetical protein